MPQNSNLPEVEKTAVPESRMESIKTDRDPKDQETIFLQSKAEPSKGGANVDDQEPADLKREKVEDVLRIVEGELSAIEDSDYRQALIEHLCNSFDWRDIIPALNDDDSLRAKPWIGSISTLTLRAFEAIQKGAENPVTLRDLLITTMAATISELERNNEGTPEQRVDIIAMPISRFVIPKSSNGLLQYAAGIRGYLDAQFVKGDGWRQSIAALGGWLGRTPFSEPKRHAVWYIHEGLVARPTEDAAKSIDAMANTMASLIDDIGGKNPSPKVLQVCNRIHALSVAADVFKGGAATETSAEDQEAGALFACLLGKTPNQPFACAKIVASIANVLPSWRYLDKAVTGELKINSSGNDVWVMFLASLAGVLGVRFYPPNDYGRIGASFFNAGVWALRTNSARFQLLRILVNSLGLVWAIRKSENPLQALGDLNGLDCAVNLYGGLTTLSRERVPPSAKLLASVLVTARDVLAAAQQTEFVRLNASWKELGINPEPTNTSLNQAVSQLLGELYGEPGELLLAPGTKEDIAATVTASLVRTELGSALGNEQFLALANDASSLFERMVSLSRDLPAAWDVLYADFVENGPLVASGLMKEDEWKKLGNDCIDRSVTSLGAFLTEENLQWMVE